MMKAALISIAALALAGCGAFADSVSTGANGYSIRCIEGTKYVLMTHANGVAITPLVDTQGKPKGCQQ